MSDLFDYVNSITTNKENLIIDTDSEKAYEPFMTNKALSLFSDCILYSQEMNMNSHLDKKLQYDYLINSIRAKKRFSKWPKRKEDENIEVIKKYYGYNHQNAKVALSILTDEQIKKIRKSLEEGG